MKKRTMTLVISLLLVALVAVGGTLAWLMDSTQTVTNTFTAGNVDITLEETGTTEDADGNDNKTYKMVPGTVLDKDPTVTVLANSEKCYLFVEVIESATLDTYIDYGIAAGWTQLNENVYYRVVDASTNAQAFDVIKASNADDAVVDKVTVKSDVTKDQMDDLAKADAVQPTLTFKAYAVQFDNVADVNAAWAVAKPTI